jgi:hypothetical protein
MAIELGPNDNKEPLIVHLAFFVANLALGTKTIAFHASQNPKIWPTKSCSP